MIVERIFDGIGYRNIFRLVEIFPVSSLYNPSSTFRFVPPNYVLLHVFRTMLLLACYIACLVS